MLLLAASNTRSLVLRRPVTGDHAFPEKPCTQPPDYRGHTEPTLLKVQQCPQQRHKQSHQTAHRAASEPTNPTLFSPDTHGPAPRRVPQHPTLCPDRPRHSGQTVIVQNTSSCHTSQCLSVCTTQWHAPSEGRTSLHLRNAALGFALRSQQAGASMQQCGPQYLQAAAAAPPYGSRYRLKVLQAGLAKRLCAHQH
jgi:hypothetical protein